jgi:hypothetical protein
VPFARAVDWLFVAKPYLVYPSVIFADRNLAGVFQGNFALELVVGVGYSE